MKKTLREIIVGLSDGQVNESSEPWEIVEYFEGVSVLVSKSYISDGETWLNMEYVYCAYGRYFRFESKESTEYGFELVDSLMENTVEVYPHELTAIKYLDEPQQ